MEVNSNGRNSKRKLTQLSQFLIRMLIWVVLGKWAIFNKLFLIFLSESEYPQIVCNFLFYKELLRKKREIQGRKAKKNLIFLRNPVAHRPLWQSLLIEGLILPCEKERRFWIGG